MWIRSQNKERLINFNAVEYEIGFATPTIKASVQDDMLTVGIYKSKERCIEIIDDIQKALTSLVEVFQMPEE